MASPAEIALRHYGDRAALTDATGQALTSMWAEVDPDDIAGSWAVQLAEAEAVVAGAQLAAAQMAEPYMAEVAAAEGFGEGEALVRAAGFSGIASDGRGLTSLLWQPVIGSLLAIKSGAGVPMALASGHATLAMIGRTQVADAGRLADQVAITARKDVDGYVRIAVGATCARCMILAGKFYRYNTGFRRHENCDCVHIGAKRATAAGIMQDPRRMYDSLTPRERSLAGWSKADQKALAEGADLNQVTNARRGLYTAGGRLLTREGTSRSATFGGFDVDVETGRLVKRPSGSVRRQRLSVDQIYADAGDDRDEAIRLLQKNGYLTGKPALAKAVPAPTPAPAKKAVAAKASPAKAKPATAEQRAQAARERQQHADFVRKRADILAEAGELILNDSGADLTRRQLVAAMQRAKLDADPVMRKLLASVSDDTAELRAAIESAARELGLTRIGADVTGRIRNRFGEFEVERVKFDRSVHKPIGGDLRPGEDADIVRPGFHIELGGKKVLLERATVMRAEDPLIDAAKPGKVTPQKAAPKAVARSREVPAAAKPYHRSIDGLDDIADAAEEASRNGSKVVFKKLSGGMSAETRLAELPDGRAIVHKRGMDWGDPKEVAASVKAQADAEQLASLVARAVDAPVARVYRTQKDAVWMEYISGASHEGTEALLATMDGFRLGLLDGLTLNIDRNSGNLMARNGRLIGIDHGFAWGQVADDATAAAISYVPAHAGTPITRLVAKGTDGVSRWTASPLHPDDVAELRRRLEALRPDFAKLGRESWLNYSLKILRKLRPHATGKERLYA